MKAFVSYSISDNNEFILTLLSSKLREKHFIITTSQNFYSSTLDYNTLSEINSSHLFIGVITGTGTERQRVLDEWRYAVQRNVPNLLLIEDTVAIHQQSIGNHVAFNRHNPQPAIDEINRRMTQPQAPSSKPSDDIVPWILGGAALLAIIGILTSKSK